MSVQVNEMKRMPAPYTSKCMDSFPVGYDLVSNYSFTMCQLYCHAQAVADNCSCFWPELYIPTDSNSYQANYNPDEVMSFVNKEGQPQH